MVYAGEMGLVTIALTGVRVSCYAMSSMSTFLLTRRREVPLFRAVIMSASARSFRGPELFPASVVHRTNVGIRQMAKNR